MTINPADDSIIENYIRQMSLEEKIELIAGDGFDTKPNERLGIPSLKMADGPMGVRWGRSTAFPAGVAMAATWNVNLIEDLGKALAREVISRGRNVILGPCVNIVRLPHGGRNFESFGEDPFLTSRMAVSYITGVQNENVVATVKHFACNNQEYERKFVDVKIDERALHEIYLPAFKAAVKEANVLAVMSAYNKVNGSFCSESDFLINRTLKKEWGFQGLVMSDWGAVHSSIPTAAYGVDLEMPDGKYMNQSALLASVKTSLVKESVIDDKIRRLLRVIAALGLFGEKGKNSKTNFEKSSREIAYQTACESIVLLKNENKILPLKKDKINSIAVIGPNAVSARTGGGGSAYVSPEYSVNPLDALKEKLGGQIKVNYRIGAKLDGDITPTDIASLFLHKDNDKDYGLLGEFFDNTELKGKPVLTRTDQMINFDWGFISPCPGLDAENYSVRWTGFIKVPLDSEYIFEILSDDGVRLFLDDELVIDDWTIHSLKYNSCELKLNGSEKHKLRLEYFQKHGEAIVKFGWKPKKENLLQEAVEAAADSDLAIVFAGTSQYFETEGHDRENIILPNNQDELIDAVARVNKNTIVVLINGSQLLMTKWLSEVNAVVEAWFGGSESGNAIADIILGIKNPSGKLPVTFSRRWEECSAFGLYKSESGTTNYSDGIFVGYRHFDKNDIEPLFPFGFGLSYTEFSYSDLLIEDKSDKSNFNIEIKVNILNTGSIEGAEVVQLYIGKKDSQIIRPIKELKAFQKIFLLPGETKQIKFKLSKSSFSYYDSETGNWKTENGEYSFMVGASSRDIKLEDKIFLNL